MGSAPNGAAGDAGMSAPAHVQRAANGVEIGLQTTCKAQKLPSFEITPENSRFDRCRADRP